MNELTVGTIHLLWCECVLDKCKEETSTTTTTKTYSRNWVRKDAQTPQKFQKGQMVKAALEQMAGLSEGLQTNGHGRVHALRISGSL